jgi:DNA-binding transcriptional ArsR family regulator
MPQDLRIDDRKLDMFEWLRVYDLLTTHQIALLDGGSEQAVSRILHRLERAGYILRPFGQRQSFFDRRDPWIHGLANRGADTLAEKRGIERCKLDWTKKNRVVKGNYKHKILINELRVRLEVDVRNHPRMSYIEEPALLKHLGVTSKTWQVPILDDGKVVEVGVTTDYFFRLVFHQEPKPHNFATFPFEADRATEPNDTNTEREDYLYRKMLAYYFQSCPI